MGSKKKTAPMWREVEDVRRLKVGDILVWPKEGTVKHLHGSASTMRSLGFSIGCRLRSISYDAARYLADRPDETRAFLVAETVRSASDGADALAFDTTVPTVSRAKMVEIPLHLKDGEGSTLSAAVAVNLLVTGLDVPASRFLGFTEADSAVKDAVDSLMRRGKTAIRSIGDETRSAMRANRTRTGPLTTDELNGIVEESQAGLDRYSPAVQDYVWFPVRVFVSAKRFGARVVRPSPELRRGLSQMIVSHALRLYAGRLRGIIEETVKFDAELRAAVSRMRAGVRAVSSMSGRMSSESIPAIGELWRALGDECPDFRYIHNEENEDV